MNMELMKSDCYICRNIKWRKDGLDPISLEGTDVWDEWVCEEATLLDIENVGWEIIEPLFLQALTLEDGEPNFDAAADNSPNENESHYNTGNGSTSIGGDQDGKIPMCYVELLPFFFYFLSLFWSTFCYVLCARQCVCFDVLRWSCNLRLVVL